MDGEKIGEFAYTPLHQQNFLATSLGNDGCTVVITAELFGPLGTWLTWSTFPCRIWVSPEWIYRTRKWGTWSHLIQKIMALFEQTWDLRRLIDWLTDQWTSVRNGHELWNTRCRWLTFEQRSTIALLYAIRDICRNPNEKEFLLTVKFALIDCISLQVICFVQFAVYFDALFKNTRLQRKTPHLVWKKVAQREGGKHKREVEGNGKFKRSEQLVPCQWCLR